MDEVAQDPSARLHAVRAEIHRVTEGWRQLLAAHLPDRRGRCPMCSGWIRRRRWPCPVWLAAQQRLAGEERARPDGAVTRPDPDEDRQPGDVEVIARVPPHSHGGDQNRGRADVPGGSARPARPVHRAAVVGSGITFQALQHNARRFDRPTT